MSNLQYSQKCQKMEVCGIVMTVPTSPIRNPICMTTLKPGIYLILVISANFVRKYSKLKTHGEITNQEFTNINRINSNVNKLDNFNQYFCFLDVESAIQSKMFKEGNIWYCNDCPYKSNRKSNLLEHVEARHVSHPGYLCQYCEKVFKTKDTWRHHQAKVHQN